MAGYLGGFAGKLLASGCLSIVVSSDGELGAWWLGWPIIAITHSLVAGCFLLLPPRQSDPLSLVQVQVQALL